MPPPPPIFKILKSDIMLFADGYQNVPLHREVIIYPDQFCPYFSQSSSPFHQIDATLSCMVSLSWLKFVSNLHYVECYFFSMLNFTLVKQGKCAQCFCLQCV